MTPLPLLTIDNLHVRFPIRAGLLQRTVGEVNAVNGVSFAVNKGEAFGIVGESGCGKTTIARAILRLVDATEGTIRYNNEDVTTIEGQQLAPFRRKVQAIFQDPFSSLNPRKTTQDIIGEPLRVHKLAEGDGINRRIKELLELVELPARFTELYPHEMSGGQRQRVGIARALAMNPEMIVCDEAVSALDVSIQAQIINLLERLRKELGLTYVFIGHDLSVVRHLCNRVAVMYLGRVMEIADSDSLFSNPSHPYTKALLDAVPNPDPSIEANRKIEPLHGEVPNPSNPPPGCVFHTRCPVSEDRCRHSAPVLQPVTPNQSAACWLTQNPSNTHP
ncbi:MAG: oligopeptide/dipeptide ABC transporter ATP-binding protein [Granulosicoccus sp.]|jgi:oligopeptide/dipeptide ABC transporter ATP-binding protein